MDFLKFGPRVCWGALCALWLIPSGYLYAQAAPGPLPPAEPLPSAPSQPQPAPQKGPEVEPRKTLAGFWKFNPNDSDDARQKLSTRNDSGSGSGGGMGGPGRRPGVGYPYPYPGGPGNGPYGGPWPTGGMGGDEEDNNSERMWDLVRPADMLAVELRDPEVDLTNEHGDKLVLYTDGRKVQKSKNDAVQAVSAHWNGSQLVTDERSPQGRKMSRTLELSSDGRQLTETWRIESRRSDAPISIRYVYDAANTGQR